MKHLVLYTMKGCHFCGQFKELLNKENIEYLDHDIFEHKEEYELFRSVKNDLVPSFMIVDDINTIESSLFAADIDYATLEEALNIIKEKL